MTNIDQLPDQVTLVDQFPTEGVLWLFLR